MKKKKASISSKAKPKGRAAPKYPRYPISKALRIPEAILKQNAGKDCSLEDAAKYLGIKKSGPFNSEVGACVKFGFLTYPSTGKVGVTDRAKKAIRPQAEGDAIEAIRDAVLGAPVIEDVYRHYRGENIPDQQFFDNALSDSFGIPRSDVAEFKTIFFDSLRSAGLLDEQASGQVRILDVSQQVKGVVESAESLQKAAKTANASASDSCFVLMPFEEPLGAHFKLIYEPAIRKAGLTPVRADADIFATGKIIDQVCSGITAAKVLVAELTSRNPNVFYELGLAHALEKPVVLVSSNEGDVPFDVRHIRVIYYDVNDPFWGEKLVSKVAENVVSALTNPSEAILKTQSK